MNISTPTSPNDERFEEITVGTIRNEGGCVTVAAILLHSDRVETRHEFQILKGTEGFELREEFYDSSKRTIDRTQFVRLRTRVKDFVSTHEYEILVTFDRERVDTLRRGILKWLRSPASYHAQSLVQLAQQLEISLGLGLVPIPEVRMVASRLAAEGLISPGASDDLFSITEKQLSLDAE